MKTGIFAVAALAALTMSAPAFAMGQGSSTLSIGIGQNKANILGILRIALGIPPYALLLALTIWAVHRYQRSTAATA